MLGGPRGGAAAPASQGRQRYGRSRGRLAVRSAVARTSMPSPVSAHDHGAVLHAVGIPASPSPSADLATGLVLSLGSLAAFDDLRWLARVGDDGDVLLGKRTEQRFFANKDEQRRSPPGNTSIRLTTERMSSPGLHPEPCLASRLRHVACGRKQCPEAQPHQPRQPAPLQLTPPRRHIAISDRITAA